MSYGKALHSVEAATEEDLPQSKKMSNWLM